MHTQRGQVHQLPSYSRWTAPGVEVGKTSAGHPGASAWAPDQAATRGKRNYPSRLRAAKATQKEDCFATKQGSALQLRPSAHSSSLTPHRLSGLWAAAEKLQASNFSPYFLLVMKRTEQWPTESLTKQISVTNTEQTRPHLADEQRS